MLNRQAQALRLGCASACAALAASFALLCGSAYAGAVTQEQLVTRAAEVYAGRLADLRVAHKLDANAAFHARVQRIASLLLARVRQDYPDTAAWEWEVHTSSDADQNADCMAGGKILVGQAYVEKLALNDAELAMLLAHEISHAALRHNLQEYERAMQIDPRWGQRPFAELEDAVDNDNVLIEQLAPLNYAQELEADEAGMRLAWHAGWPAARLANYFRKMMRDSGYPNFERSGYPAPALRWRAASAVATTLK
ncbi:M48 family metalloprotease [Oxalobacteraceae bacterium]|nr:M48 family metalloprotease [Oxalobacteraceae bacterium]